MRVICIYRDNQDYSRSVEEFLENFRRATGREIETMNPDENPGFCEAYDVVEYPTILALGNQGEVRASWRGRDLPLINEVAYVRFASVFREFKTLEDFEKILKEQKVKRKESGEKRT